MKRGVVIVFLVVALLLVLTGIGTVVFFTIRGGADVFNGRIQAHATLEENKVLKVDAKNPVTLNVIDDAGSVTIIGGDVTGVELKMVKTAYAVSQSRAEQEVKEIKYDIDQAGNRITLTYEYPNASLANFPDVPAFDLNADTVDFIVTVPNETTVDIDNNLGDASVTGINGDVAIKDDFGKVTIEEVEGALNIHTNSGDVTVTSIMAGQQEIVLATDFGKITLNKVNGETIELDTNSGALQLTDVRATSDIIANTDFGDVRFENGSARTLHVETNSGGVSLFRLEVEEEIFVKDDFGGIELEQALAGSYDLHTNSGSVTVDGATGKLKADTDFGDIEIHNAESVLLEATTNSGSVKFNGSLGNGPHLVKSDFGSIEINLPAASKLNVDLKTDFGKITSDLPVTVTLDGNSTANGDHIIGSINGGGGQLTVQANSGPIDIKILK